MMWPLRIFLFITCWALAICDTIYYVNDGAKIYRCAFVDTETDDVCSTNIDLGRTGITEATMMAGGKAFDLIHSVDGALQEIIVSDGMAGNLCAWDSADDGTVTNGRFINAYTGEIRTVLHTWDASHTTVTYLLGTGSNIVSCSTSSCDTAYNGWSESSGYRGFLYPEDSAPEEKTLYVIDGNLYKCSYGSACASFLGTVPRTDAPEALVPEFDASGVLQSLFVLSGYCKAASRWSPTGTWIENLYYDSSQSCLYHSGSTWTMTNIQAGDVERAQYRGETVAYWILDGSTVLYRCLKGGACTTRDNLGVDTQATNMRVLGQVVPTTVTSTTTSSITSSSSTTTSSTTISTTTTTTTSTSTSTSTVTSTSTSTWTATSSTSTSVTSTTTTTFSTTATSTTTSTSSVSSTTTTTSTWTRTTSTSSTVSSTTTSTSSTTATETATTTATTTATQSTTSSTMVTQVTTSSMPVATTAAATTTTAVATTTAAASTTVTATTTVTSTTTLQTTGTVYYYTNKKKGLVYKCDSELDECATWLDSSSVASLVPSAMSFRPTAIHLDKEADGTSRGIVIGTSLGDVIYCDMTPSACNLVTSRTLSSVGGIATTWDSEHSVSSYGLTLRRGGGLVSLDSDNTGTWTRTRSWKHSRGSFFFVDPEDDSSDIISCTSRKRVERCPCKVKGRPSDCTMLVRGKCTGIAPEFGADGALTGFVAVFSNRVKTCQLDGTNCQVVDGKASGKKGSGEAELRSPTAVAVERVGTRGESVAYWIVDAGNKRIKRCTVDGEITIYGGDVAGVDIAVESISTQEEVVVASESYTTETITAEVEVTIGDTTNFEEAMSPVETSEAWLAVEEVVNTTTGEDGWSLESITDVSDYASGRRLADGEVTYALTFKLNYIAGTRSEPDLETMVTSASAGLMDAINDEVSGGNWTVLEMSYIGIQDNTSVAQAGTVPEWASIGTTNVDVEEYDAALATSTSLAVGLSFFALAMFVALDQ